MIVPLCVVIALIGAVLARSAQPPAITLTSHGATDCDSDGISIGYDVSYFEDTSPDGYRVTDANVTGIDPLCEGHTIYVSLTSGAEGLGNSGVVTISGTSMTLPLSPRPLASLVDGVYAEIDDRSLPDPDPTPSVTPTPTPTPTPSVTPTQTPVVPAPPVTPVPSVTPTPSGDPTPGFIIVPDPDGVPSTVDECSIEWFVCGTDGADHGTGDEGSALMGPGNDTVAVVTTDRTKNVYVDAGAGADSVSLEVNAPADSVQQIVVETGPGPDHVGVSFGSIAPGAIVDITIRTQGGDDLVGLPAFIPAGVTIRISSGAGDDRVIAEREVTIEGRGAVAFFNRMLFANASSRGYLINAGRGSDVVRGGVGSDTIRLARGHDRASGAAGNDSLFGGRGRDLLQGGPGNDLVSGGRNHDVLRGGEGRDDVRGGRGSDTCFGVGEPGSMTSCEVRR